MNDDDIYYVDPAQLTWTERNVWYPIGWIFNEIAFRSGDFAWEYLLYPSWCFTIGGYFAGLALTREAQTRLGKDKDWN